MEAGPLTSRRPLLGPAFPHIIRVLTPPLLGVSIRLALPARPPTARHRLCTTQRKISAPCVSGLPELSGPLTLNRTGQAELKLAHTKIPEADRQPKKRVADPPGPQSSKRGKEDGINAIHLKRGTKRRASQPSAGIFPTTLVVTRSTIAHRFAHHARR